jgi:hypothetical protein
MATAEQEKASHDETHDCFFSTVLYSTTRTPCVLFGDAATIAAFSVTLSPPSCHPGGVASALTHEPSRGSPYPGITHPNVSLFFCSSLLSYTSHTHTQATPLQPTHLTPATTTTTPTRAAALTTSHGADKDDITHVAAATTQRL